LEISLKLAEIDESESLIEFLCKITGENHRKLAIQYVEAMHSNFFRKPTFVIAKQEEEIIGCASFTEEFFTVNVWDISWVCVRENFRNKGIGKKIIVEVLSQIRRKISSPVTVILDTYPNKTGLYDNTGFKFLGHDHEGGSFMTLTLNPRG
jgi:predicted GNAT family N-acyltransferase